MSFANIFRPAPPVDEIKDEETVKKMYRYWRWRIFIGMYVGYTFFYFTRKSYTCIMPVLREELGFTKGELGILASILALTYGLSKFLSGIMVDRSNSRIVMSIGLILTGIVNIFFGASSSLLWFALFWGLNGWFQGWGAPPCIKLLTHWYSQKERGTWWGMWNSSHNVGGAIIPIIVGICAQLYGWRYGMYVPGVLCIGIGIFLLFALRDTPQSLGLPPIEKFRNDYPAKNVDQEVALPLKQMLLKYVLKNSYIWILAVAYFFVHIIRGAINDWTALFLMETRGYSIVMANASIVWFEVGGIVGSLVAGWASDKIFGGRRGPINVLFSLAVTATLLGLWLMPPGHILFDYTLIFLIGFLIFGPQMLIGIAAVELSHKKAAGSANGFIGWIAYLGLATSGYPLSVVTELLGWDGFFIALAACGIITVLLIVPLWSIKTNPKYLEAEPALQSETEPASS